MDEAKNWRTHPAYREGFDDAILGEPLFLDASEPYRAGWEAAHYMRQLLKEHGFREGEKGQFSKQTIVAARA